MNVFLGAPTHGNSTHIPDVAGDTPLVGWSGPLNIIPIYVGIRYLFGYSVRPLLILWGATRCVNMVSVHLVVNWFVGSCYRYAAGVLVNRGHKPYRMVCTLLNSHHHLFQVFGLRKDTNPLRNDFHYLLTFDISLFDGHRVIISLFSPLVTSFVLANFRYSFI